MLRSTTTCPPPAQSNQFTGPICFFLPSESCTPPDCLTSTYATSLMPFALVTVNGLSLDFDVRDFDHFSPLFQFHFQLRREFRGRVAFGLEAERDQLLLDFRSSDDRSRLLVQPRDDRLWRA